MGSGTRHLLGVIAGVIAIPVVFGLAVGGLGYLARSYEYFVRQPAPLYLAGGLIVATGIVLALLVGTRVSPLASLLPGLVFFVIGAAFIVVPLTALRAFRAVLPSEMHLTSSVPPLPVGLAATSTEAIGGYLLIGVVLVVASIAPSRWRAKARPALPGAHRAASGAGPAPEESWPPPQPSVPSDPAARRATPPLPGDAAAEYPPPEYPYGSGPQAPYGSGPQAPYGSGPQAPYGSGPQAPYGAEAAPAGGGGGLSGYGPGERPSSWSGPQAPYSPEPGTEPYASAGPASGAPAEPWGPPPETGTPATRAFSAESEAAAQGDPTPRTMPDANANDATHRIPWSEADRRNLRDDPGR